MSAQGMTDENLKLLDDAQKTQVLMQWERHQHDDFQTDFLITPYGETLEGFKIFKGVWNPTIVSARHHAAFLFYHNHLFYGKTAVDIGCGTGLMGIVMAKYGAKQVTLSDCSEVAVQNAKENVKTFKLDEIANVVQGDLFENIQGKADCITFMQPYFAGTPPEGDTISASMLASPDLIKRFLAEAPRYLNSNGVIVMPSFSLAGDLNNPAVVGKESGYVISTTFIADSATGLQKGEIAMHELRLK
ncbi:MAG: class I SAM-dependent methyltransferase [Parcubacteria group bacterium]|nr:class I SAM-dependent methyltransferase [Parcubacteria group bacterium]